jgi:pantoate--beta-alanine ligase
LLGHCSGAQWPGDVIAKSAAFSSLQWAKETLAKKKLAEIKNEVEATLIQIGMRLEYFELADRNNLAVLQEFNHDIPSILLMAAYVGQVRLIDNLFV